MYLVYRKYAEGDWKLVGQYEDVEVLKTWTAGEYKLVTVSKTDKDGIPTTLGAVLSRKVSVSLLTQ